MNMCERKCRHCVHDGHNSGRCRKGCTGIKLFGVQITVPASEDGTDQSTIRKSKSLGNLQACNPENTAAAEPSGYLSDGLVHQSSKSHERKRGKPWSEDEHRSFLAGLEKLGKGDWKGIANNFVPSRNSSQVASHAQKYFIRLSATEKKRRRASVFDIPLTNNQPSQGSQSNKVDESLLPASISSAAAASKNVCELKGQVSSNPYLQASTPAPVVTSERPPLSPMKRRGIPELPSMVYLQPRVSSFTKGFSTQTVMPTVSWVPVVNFSSQSSVFLPNIHGSLATFVPQPSVATLRQSLRQGSSQAGSAAPTAKNEELNLNIRKLTL